MFIAMPTLTAAVRPDVTDSTTPSLGAGVIRHVLVVDDSPSQRELLSRLIRRWGFDVRSAASGAEALALCREQPPDMVFSDWMMPGMDGLEFCRRFRRFTGPEYGYFTLITSKSDKTEIAQGLDAGADDLLVKPLNAEELRARISAGARLVAMQRELAAKSRDLAETLERLQEAYDTLDRDLRQARRIQESLVPDRERRFGPHRVSLMLQPCGHVGGDLVGVVSPGLGRIGLYGLDVSGHGITSAMVAARVAGYLNDAFPEQNLAMSPRGAFYALQPPAEVASRLNRRLTTDPGVEEYLTLCYATVDFAQGRVELVQAGHPPPLLIRADGTLEFLGSGGLPIGLVDHVTHDSLKLTLAPGDRLLIYSDGLTETETRDGSLLGEDGLTALVREALPLCGSEFLGALFNGALATMKRRDLPADDISAALLEFGA
ncbi:PP2C family protein-serine/threonine phosphatase [Litorisediminicola beolgyonensis]|uniref:PP2C family protein-serine/threonine phosphatase n=1 Tax=Litorisediminicola beolgyonensis TaxID=1173614 RepID=A0ABW3ZM19_9RHOB